MIRGGLRAVLAGALFWLLAAVPALAHEVRPALVQIVETAPNEYVVTWKRPVVGDMALRLIPHLSGGALEAAPTAEEAAPGFVVRVWRIKGGHPLDGQTLSVEGLPQSVTDVLVRVTARDGHTIDAVLRPSRASMPLSLSPPKGLAVSGYLKLGVEHILTGIDHLLFVLGLLLLIGPRWPLVKTVTAFTVAHSITLGLAALGYLSFPSATIEALVALSIIFVALELTPARLRRPGLARRQPWIIAFTFGLLHGMAFAGALSQIGLPPRAAPQALLLFNVGVEVGQLLFIAAALAVMAGLRAVQRAVGRPAPAWATAAPAYAIGGLACYWLIERVATAVTSAS